METPSNMPHKSKWPFMLLAVLLSIYVLTLTRNAWTEHDYIGRSEAQIYTISISGRGEITSRPDIASISIGLQTESKEVADAQRENTDKMNAIIAEIKNLGIDEDDVKTTQYSVNPNYDYSRDSGRRLLGYRVSQSVNVKIRDFDNISAVLDFAGRSGANSIGGLQFTIDDPEEIQQQARELALANAKEKAERLAKVAGVKLGKLVSFNESGYAPTPYAARSFAVAEDAGFGGAAPAIEPGSQDVVINVTVTYEVL